MGDIRDGVYKFLIRQKLLGVILICLAAFINNVFAANIYIKSPYSSSQLFIAGNQEFGWWSGRQMVSQNDGWFQVSTSKKSGADILSIYPDHGRTSDQELADLSTIFNKIGGDDVYIEFTSSTTYEVRDRKTALPVSSSVIASSSSSASISSSGGVNHNGHGTVGSHQGQTHDLGSILPDTLFITAGDSVDISATGIKLSEWSGTDAYHKINDSLIRVSPSQQSIYYLKSYSNLSVANENSSFELPVNGKGVRTHHHDKVPGWKTTATDSKIEMWNDAYQVKAYQGSQFVELNATMVGDLYQDIATTPGDDIIVEFAHRGRAGPDRMGLKMGPPEGPYQTIGEYTDGTAAWGFYREIIRIPPGQTQTRIFFTSNGYTGSSVGNFLDAVSYTSARSSTDSVVVIVEYPMEVASPLKASIYDDGDGIADSLSIQFDMALTGVNHFDSLTVYWGTDSTTHSWDKFLVKGDRLYLSQQEFSQGIYTGSQNQDDQSRIKLYYSDLVYQSGTQLEKHIKLTDKAGPVMIEAFLLQGDRQLILAEYSESLQNDFDDQRDALVVYQSKDEDGVEKALLYQDFEYARGWATTEIYQGENLHSIKDSIRLTVDQGLFDLSGNRPHVNNAYVPITTDSSVKVIQQSMDVANPLKATIHDDGDGIADSLFLQFDRELSEANRFDSLTIYWGTDSTTHSWSEFQVKDHQAVLSQKEFSRGIYTGVQYQTSEQDQSSLKLYYSDFVYQTGTRLEKLAPLQDRVGPIILSAHILPGSPQQVLVEYSERVKDDFADERDALVLYQSKSAQGVEMMLDYHDFSYVRDSLKSEVYQEESLLSSKDSIRFTVNEGLMDLLGNRPHIDHPYVQIKSHQVLDVKRIHMAEVPEFDRSRQDISSIALEMVDSRLKLRDIPALTGRIGTRYDLDLRSLIDDFQNVDPSLIVMNWSMDVYTSQGGFVNEESGQVECDDPLFEGGCIEENRLVYVGWNMIDANGRQAGSGAYIGRVTLTLIYDDQILFEDEALWTFGVRRTNY